MKSITRKKVASWLVSSTLLSASVGASALAQEENPVATLWETGALQEILTETSMIQGAVSTDTLYFTFSNSNEYLTMSRYLAEYGTDGLSTSIPSFSSNVANGYRTAAANRSVVHQILSKITTEDASQDEKALAIYNFFIYNFIRDDTTRETMPTINKTSYSMDTVHMIDRGTQLLYTGTGGCQEFMSGLHRLFVTAGIPSMQVTGDYVNRDGSTLFHGFNRAKIGDTWYWYDVDVEGSVYRRGDASTNNGTKPIYYLYKKGDSDWVGNHNWNAESIAEAEYVIDNTPTLKSGTIFDYEYPTTITFQEKNFTPSHGIFGYVDMDSTYSLSEGEGYYQVYDSNMTQSVMFFPLEEVMGFLGGSTTWNGDTGYLEVQVGNTKMEFRVGAQTYWHNGVECLMTLPVRVQNGVDYISAEDVMLLFGFDMNVDFYLKGGEVQQLVRFQGGSSDVNIGASGTGSVGGTGSTGTTGTTGSTGTDTNTDDTTDDTTGTDDNTDDNTGTDDGTDTDDTTGATPEEEEEIRPNDVYSFLDGVQYQYYTSFGPNVDENSTILSGALPRGLGLNSDGTLSGVPLASGSFMVTFDTPNGSKKWNIIIAEQSDEGVKEDGVSILTPLGEVNDNNQNYTFETQNSTSLPDNAYINGVKLVSGVDYTLDSNNKLTLLPKAICVLGEGSHTFTVTFEQGEKSVSQVFTKTVGKETSLVMSFSDLKETDWYYDSIMYMIKEGVFSGVTADTFEPMSGMTRAMMVTVLYALAERPETSGHPAVDVSSTDWYAQAVSWAMQMNVDDSVSSFRPNELVTREETARMLYNFADVYDIALPMVMDSQVKDMDTLTEKGQEALSALLLSNIISGDSEGNFNPSNTATRAEISIIMKNFIAIKN